MLLSSAGREAQPGFDTSSSRNVLRMGPDPEIQAREVVLDVTWVGVRSIS